MNYNIDAKNGNKLSILGFGCMRFQRNAGQIDYKKAENLVLSAYNNGVNYFDTAYLYLGSEEILGKILENNNLRDKIFIATKLPFSKCKSYEDFDKYFNEQLASLKTNYIDYYLIHNMAEVSQLENLISLGIDKWIQSKKENNQIRNIGFSFHGNTDMFPKILDGYNWDFCQIQYNYLNINYQAGRSGLNYAKEKGIPVIIMEPLLGGKLATKIPNEVIETFKKVNDLSPASWAFRWLFNQDGVSVVLSGMNEQYQLDENIKTASNTTINSMNDVEQKAIDKAIDIFNKRYKINCTGCNYCMPCHKGVNIPDCFSAYNMYHAIGKIDGIKLYLIGTRMGFSKGSNVASNCVSCKICEKKCPQNIEISKELKLVKKKLEPKILVILARIVRKFM